MDNFTQSITCMQTSGDSALQDELPKPGVHLCIEMLCCFNQSASVMTIWCLLQECQDARMCPRSELADFFQRLKCSVRRDL